MFQSKKRLAIILCGLHYCKDYLHYNKESYFINYQHYFYNIKKSLYNFFESNYDIDTFISTNDSPILNNLLDDYKPLEYIISNESKNNKLLKILELFLLQYANNYDALILTRFDIYFLKTFINIDYNKLNIISILETSNVIDDNFYFIPNKYIGNFLIILIENLKSNNKDCLHYLKSKIEKCFNINYLLNEFVEVSALSFYKLRFFSNAEFILNKFDFTKNVLYYSKNSNSSLLIDDNIITFTKINNGRHNYCWVANNISDPGIYNLSFDIYSNSDIINFDFIKLHNPVKYYKCKNILAYTWENINVIIETSKNDDLLCLIFDNFNKSINIKLQNIEVSKLNIVDGIILNNLNLNNYKSKNLVLSKIEANTFKIFKKKNNTIEHHTWFGYYYKPSKVETILSFDIKFTSNIPNINDKFLIKTHEPVNLYSDWLSFCVKNEFINIKVKLQLKKQEQLILFMMDEFLGECNFIIKNINFESSDINYKMISFYTQGKPYDNCLNLSNSANRYAKLISEYVDEVRFYSKSELQNNKDTEFLVKEYSNEPIYNKCTNLIGYLRWKPYIILDTLTKSNENDIIYYRDSNIDKYPSILNGLEYTLKYLNLVLNETDIFAPLENLGTIKMKHHIKREVFEKIDAYPNNYLNDNLINASIIITRKTDTSIKFFTEWLELCNDENLISPNYSSIQDNQFKWNTQEQSIMNVLMKKYISQKLLPYKFPFYGIIERSFESSSIVKAIKVAILICGEMRNYNNPELIKRNNQFLFTKYNCDIFISTWENKGYSPYHGSVDTKNYSSDKISDDIINNYNNVKNINIENYESWFSNLPDEYKEIYNLGLNCGNKIVNATVFPQLYKIWDANRMKVLYENEHNFKYDIVIRFRPDMCLVEEIPNKYLNEFIKLESNNNNKIWTSNPTKIFYPNRIYDIFYYGNSDCMNTIAESWINILKYIKDPFDNGLPKVDSCRVLYVAALLNNLNVIDISRCIGDIYRDESIQEYTNKIFNIFN